MDAEALEPRAGLGPAEALGSGAHPWRLSTTGRLDRSDRAWLQGVLEDPARFDALPHISRGNLSSVARAELSCGPVVLKRYRFAAAPRLRTFGHRSLAQREAEAMSRVAAALPDNSVQVLAWGEQRRLGFVSAAVLVTSDFEGSCDLRQLKRAKKPERSAMLEAVLDRLPAVVAQLHAGGIFARALRGKNILLRLPSQHFAVIDLPRSERIEPRLETRHRAYDLACLSIELRRTLDAEQWEGFLHSYHLASGLTPEEFGQLSRSPIEQLAARIDHRTPFSTFRRKLTRRFRHSALGARVLGLRRSKGS